MNYHSGKLFLTKAEKEALRVVVQHTKANLSWEDGGSFNCENPKGEDFIFDKKEARKANKGIEVIEQMLEWLEM